MGSKGSAPLQGLNPIVNHSPPGRCPGLLWIGPTARGSDRVAPGYCDVGLRAEEAIALVLVSAIGLATLLLGPKLRSFSARGKAPGIG